MQTGLPGSFLSISYDYQQIKVKYYIASGYYRITFCHFLDIRNQCKFEIIKNKKYG
jgi:hypothetical protein